MLSLTFMKEWKDFTDMYRGHKWPICQKQLDDALLVYILIFFILKVVRSTLEIRGRFGCSDINFENEKVYMYAYSSVAIHT